MIGLHFQEIYYETYQSVNDHLNIPTNWIQKYGRFSIGASTIHSWNSMQNLLLKNLSLKNSTSKEIKYYFFKNFIGNYQQQYTCSQLKRKIANPYNHSINSQLILINTNTKLQPRTLILFSNFHFHSKIIFYHKYNFLVYMHTIVFQLLL